MIAAGGVGGAVLAGVALVDWHYALRYVGVLGTQLTFFGWLSSYDSPQVKAFTMIPGRLQLPSVAEGADDQLHQIEDLVERTHPCCSNTGTANLLLTDRSAEH